MSAPADPDDDDDSDLYSIDDRIYFSLLKIENRGDGQTNLAGVPRGAELGSHQQLEIWQTWVEGTLIRQIYNLRNWLSMFINNFKSHRNYHKN